MLDAGIPSGPPVWAMVAWCGDLLVVVLVLVGIARGAVHGVFPTVLEGIAVAAGLLLGLTFAPLLARLCVAIDVPREIALGLVFTTLFLAPVVGLESVVRCRPGRFAVHHGPAVDAVAGGFAGALAGGLAAGGTLIAWSMLPLGAGIDLAGMRLDAGRGVLTGFARTAEPDPAARRVLLAGEPWDGDGERVDRAAPDGGTDRVAMASEVFVDLDADGVWDDDESFIDADGDGSFSPRVPYADLDGDGSRAIGWLERYRLGRWERVVSVPWDGGPDVDAALGSEAAPAGAAVRQGAAGP